MSYLDKLNRFASNPVNLDMKRSTFKRPFEHKTTFLSGLLIPIMIDEVLPGDTYNVNINSLVRSITPAVPVMDNAYLDIFAFWVPNRISCVHEHDWEKICGENFSTAWAPASEATLENTGNTTTYNSLMPVAGSLADYMGIPIYNYEDKASLEDVDVYDNLLISKIPFIGYYKIWNEWFRDQNVQAPITNLSGYAGSAGTNTSLMPVNKFHDYFTSALPAPQKADSVLLPLLGSAPVKTSAIEHTKTGTNQPLKLRQTTNNSFPGGKYYLTANTSGQLGNNGNVGTGNGDYTMYPSNLYADLSAATSASVNEIRQAFALQRLFEKDARGGSRFREMLRAQYGTSIPDNTVQVPEYLGGKRIPLNMQQVIQNSETDTTPLGTTGAFSNTFDNAHLFTKSFAEHGYIHVYACVRTQNTYSQGVPRHFMRNRRFDWYYPVFANLGEQPVKKIELYLPSSGSASSTYVSGVTAFGYQEAWAEYRYKPSQVSGELAPAAGNALLTPWTYTTFLTSIPTLNSDFIKEPRSKIDNTLVVTDSSYHFIADFYFDMTTRRVMPIYSIPGLIDHH